MKKKLIIIAIMSILSTSCYGNQIAVKNSDIQKTDIIELALNAYTDFLSGNIGANWEDSIIYVGDIYMYGSAELESRNMYALFDMNGDDIPELHVRSGQCGAVFSYYENGLKLWAMYPPYGQITNRKAIMAVRSSGAPPHITYRYQIFDFFGKVLLDTYFEIYDANNVHIYDENDLYLFENVEVSKEDWSALTEKYLADLSDMIEWEAYGMHPAGCIPPPH